MAESLLPAYELKPLPAYELKPLPSAAAQRLREAVRPLMRDKADATVEAFLATLDWIVCRFCHDERSESRKPPSEVQREFARLGQRIDSFLAALGRLSPEARERILDGEVLPRFEWRESWAEEEHPDHSLQHADNNPTTPRQPAPERNDFVDPVLVTLNRLRATIPKKLEPTGNKGGAPFRLAWHNLAWRLAFAMRDHLGERPTRTSTERFADLLDACLRVGLDTNRSKARVPGDLSRYLLYALEILDRREKGIKPWQK